MYMYMYIETRSIIMLHMYITAQVLYYMYMETTIVYIKLQSCLLIECTCISESMVVLSM